MRSQLVLSLVVVASLLGCRGEAPLRQSRSVQPLRVGQLNTSVQRPRVTHHAAVDKPSTAPSVATVNGVPIPLAAWKKQLSRHSDSMSYRRAAVRKDIQKAAVYTLIDRELLRQEAQRLKLEVNDAHVADRFDTLRVRYPGLRGLKRWITSRRFDQAELFAQFREELYEEAILTHQGKLSVTDDDLAEYYKNNRFLYYYPNRVRASMITLYYPYFGDKAKNKIKTQARLNKIRDRAVKGEDFATLARMYSGHRKIAEKGGDVGYMDKALNLVGLFDDMIEKFQPGDITPVHDLGEYCAIYKVTEREDAGYVPLAKVIDDVRVNVLRKKTLPLRNALREALRKQAKIVISTVVSEAKE